VAVRAIAVSAAALRQSADSPQPALLQQFEHAINDMMRPLVGLVERDSENAWLAADATGSGPLDDLLGHLITYRIAVGPRAGQKLFTLRLTSSGQVRDHLKSAYRDGTTHIVLEPLDLMARLAALVPPPRMHLTRYHGVFAPNSRLRAAVTPAKRGVKAAQPAQPSGQTPRHVAMSWAKRLKRG
jgi:hypothetical protein